MPTHLAKPFNHSQLAIHIYVSFSVNSSLLSANHMVSFSLF